MALKYLEKNGYEILDRNFYTKFGEIDIIGIKEKEIIFFEVKTRRNQKYGSPAEAVNYYKKKHFIKSAEFYMYSKKMYTEKIRFDVIEVYLGYGKAYINHICNII